MTKARRRPHRPVDPWAGIEPENRPTPERMRQGGQVRTWLEPMRKGEHGPPMLKAKIDSAIEPVEFKEKGEGRLKGKASIHRTPTPVDLAHSNRALTVGQRDAALRFENIAEIIGLRGGTRDSLDLEPRGSGDMSDTAAVKLASAKSEHSDACKRLHRYENLVIHSVVVHHRKIGSYKGRRMSVLRSGLDKLAKHWENA